MTANRIVPQNDSSSKEKPVNIYLVDGGERNCAIEDFDELGTLYEDCRVISMVFAETPGHARKLFIGFHDSFDSYTRYSFEWTDAISIRLLARDVDIPIGILQQPDPEVLDHCEEKLTRFGREFWLKYWNANEEVMS